MTDLTELRRWTDDDPEPDHWPPPDEHVEWQVTGRMRTDVLAKIGRPADDAADVRLIETTTEHGYSEWTIEIDYDVEVWVHETAARHSACSSPRTSTTRATASPSSAG